MTSNSTNCSLCDAKYNDDNKAITRNGVSFCEKCVEAGPFLANRQPKEEYDDNGVLCRYTEEDGWYAIEDHCITCGYRCDECECDDGEEDWIYPCEECDGRPCECKSK